MKFVNTHDLSMSVAVWLSADSYEHDPDPMTISATTLLKSTKQIILNSRLKDSDDTAYDIVNNIPSSLGTAIHDGIYNAWVDDYKSALTKLNFPKHVIKNVKINPKADELTADTIPIYMEQRAHKKVGKFTISGQYDFVSEGTLEDFKSTGVFSYISKSNDAKHVMQGSIYRWLNPDIITNDYMYIQYIFTDWSKLRASVEQKKGYPQQRIVSEKYLLHSIEKTDQFIHKKLADILAYWDTSEANLPKCSSEELWQSPSVFKYYKNPDKQKRSTANFPDFQQAHTRCMKDGNVGIVIEQKGQIRACGYCNAANLCTQKDKYIANGTLVI